MRNHCQAEAEVTKTKTSGCENMHGARSGSNGLIYKAYKNKVFNKAYSYSLLSVDTAEKLVIVLLVPTSSVTVDFINSINFCMKPHGIS